MPDISEAQRLAVLAKLSVEYYGEIGSYKTFTVSTEHPNEKFTVTISKRMAEDQQYKIDRQALKEHKQSELIDAVEILLEKYRRTGPLCEEFFGSCVKRLQEAYDEQI